jgi:hypothetical protein
VSQILTTASTMNCLHGGTVQAISANTRVRCAGDFALRASDTFLVVGCGFSTPATGPHPCVSVQWVSTATRSKVIGDPPLNDSSVGLCVAADQAVQGTVLIGAVQPRVAGV